MKRFVTALFAMALIWMVPPAANAEVVTRSDPRPACSQRPALDVKRATFNYDDERFVWKIKMGRLSRERTRVIARYTLGARAGTRYDVVLATWFGSDGLKRVRGEWSDYETGDYGNRFTKGLTAKWDWQRETIKITLTTHVRGRTADAWAYSIAKGQFHGPHCGDYISSGRISRG